MLDIAVPQITATTSEPSYGSYDIEPLEAGFGQTLGNALRRVLLSSLSGAAVTSIRIDGVKHEFQDIPGVKEDVTDIVLNVKKIRLRSFSDRPVTMRLEVNGGERETVTAADIEAPSTVEIVNPEQVICTIDEPDAHVDMELVVETGKGYVPAESKDDQPIGQIPVDAIFTPVVRVNYTVEHTRVGQMTNYDKIILQIWTDGTITPDQAMRQAANILVTHFGMIAGFNERPEIEPAYGGPVAAQVAEAGAGARGETSYLIPQRIYDMPIEELDLSVRAYNCLKRSNITRVGQVLTMNRDDLLAVRNFGEKSLTELEEKLLERRLLPQVGPEAEHGGAATEDEGQDEGEEEE
ncbi:MAG TPA: DNA-directed RNA polymerase subunit alpha [Ktedonobacterales bacterium]